MFSKSQILIFVLVAVAAHSQVISSFQFPTVPSIPVYSYGSNNCCTTRTITVDGSATVQANPDIAYISVTLSVNGKTANDAVAKLSAKTTQLTNVLVANGLTSSNYESTSVSIYPNTSYANGVSTVLGQIATQSIKVTVPSIAADGSNLGKLIDGLASVNGIMVNGLDFDISNKTAVYASARKLAYLNAQLKAQDYTTAAGVGIGKLLKVTDSFSSAPVVERLDQPLMSMALSNKVSTPTTVNVGTIPISYNVESIYAIA